MEYTHSFAARRYLIAGILFALSSVFIAPAASAATFAPDLFTDETGDGGTCTSGSASDCSLREALDAAEASAEADVIELSTGTYTLSITGDTEDLNATGDLDVLDTTDPVTIRGGWR